MRVAITAVHSTRKISTVTAVYSGTEVLLHDTYEYVFTSTAVALMFLLWSRTSTRSKEFRTLTILLEFCSLVNILVPAFHTTATMDAAGLLYGYSSRQSSK